MLIGYARVSTHEQTLALQQDALEEAGCERVFTDTASGAKAERRGLEEALDFVRSGDTLVVWRLDRLGRSLQHLIAVMTRLQERGIGFRSLTEQIDTTTSGGKLIFHVFACRVHKRGRTSRYAARRSYSWMSPPSRSRRTTAPVRRAGRSPARGGRRPSARCGRARL